MKTLIVTAIDDNNGLWYEHVIPFLLSIRQTDYQGEVGIINYGLSSDKLAALERFDRNIRIFPAAHQYPNILIDRQVSTAHIAAQHDYDAIALIDADIWFCHSRFSLFEQLLEQDKLYCAYDVWRCTFLTDCVKESHRTDVSRLLDQLIEKQQYVWQAGVMAAHSQGWKEYLSYLSPLLEDTEKYEMVYGIDALVLNLYSLEHNNVNHLSKKYNCLPAWGIYQHNEGYGVEFKIDNEPAEAIHVSRAHRKGGEYSYHKLYAKNYFEQGKTLRIKEYPYYRISPESVMIFNETEYQTPTALEFVSAHTDGCFIVSLERQGTFFPKNTFFIETGGISSIVFKNTQASAVRLAFSANMVMNYEPCEEIYLKIEGKETKVDANSLRNVDIQPNSTVEFLVKELNVEGKRIRWAFQHLKLH